MAVVLDVFSRKVVGWSLARAMTSPLPLAALNQAIARRQPTAGLVHHSDRRSQYACEKYVDRLKEVGFVVSMSRPARPWENAYCESFMNTLKSEEIHCRAYSTLEELNRNIEDFIERYCNCERLHSALSYWSPEEFEQQHAADVSSVQNTEIPVALSFLRHRKIYPDAALIEATESGLTPSG